MRTIALLLAVTLGTANLVSDFSRRLYLTQFNHHGRVQTLRRRLPPIYVKGGLVDWKSFKVPAFNFYTIGGMIAFLGLYTGMHS